MNAINTKVLLRFFPPMCLYNTNGFRTKTMYDYYIVMKSMFLVVKLSSHYSIGYASLIISPTMNYTYTTLKLFKTKSLSKLKLQFLETLYSYHNFIQMKMFFKVTNTSLNTNQKETNQETS